MQKPILYIVIPCYNEQEVLPIVHSIFLKKLTSLIEYKKLSDSSCILFINDGSTDQTWEIIKQLSQTNSHFKGLCLSRNYGHQNALLAGLMHAKEFADISISIDCDGQDDINAMDKMLDEFYNGCDIVYGVRNKREKDSAFKKFTAESFYKLLKLLGGNTVYNHADYRLMSKRALIALERFQEKNLFLRGIIPMIGYRSSIVYYERENRIAGKTHYSLSRMLSLASDGITNISVKPLRMISALGFIICALSSIAVLWTLFSKWSGNAVDGWASLSCAIFFMGGIQLLSIGVVGEYIGKIYTEVKQRPNYIISETTTSTFSTSSTDI